MTKKDLLKQLGWSDKLIAEFEEMAQPIRERNQRINSTLNSNELTHYSTTNSIYVDSENVGSNKIYKRT